MGRTNHGSTPPPADLAVIDSEEQELERARKRDVNRDASQIAELRAFISEVVQNLKSLTLKRVEAMTLSVAERPGCKQRQEKEAIISISSIEAGSRTINDPLLLNEQDEAASKSFCELLVTTPDKGSPLGQRVELRLGVIAELLVQVRYSRFKLGTPALSYTQHAAQNSTSRVPVAGYRFRWR